MCCIIRTSDIQVFEISDTLLEAIHISDIVILTLFSDKNMKVGASFYEVVLNTALQKFGENIKNHQIVFTTVQEKYHL